MRHDLAEKWRERLLVLKAQLEREPALAWRWQGQAKVLRFLLRRYGETDAPADMPVPELSALEHSLLRLALSVAIVNPKHLRPSPRERSAILARIRVAGEQARATEEPISLWPDISDWIETWGYGGVEARHDAERLREREEERERREREQFWEERERRR